MCCIQRKKDMSSVLSKFPFIADMSLSGVPSKSWRVYTILLIPTISVIASHESSFGLAMPFTGHVSHLQFQWVSWRSTFDLQIWAVATRDPNDAIARSTHNSGKLFALKVSAKADDEMRIGIWFRQAAKDHSTVLAHILPLRWIAWGVKANTSNQLSSIGAYSKRRNKRRRWDRWK